MANLKGEVTFKVTFNNLGVPASMYSSGIIYKECAQQVYASAPWSSIGYKKDHGADAYTCICSMVKHRVQERP